MADKKSLLDAFRDRRSIYKLAKESPISDDRIRDLTYFTIKHTPSSFNVQSARAIILFGKQHDKFWQKADEAIKGMVPEEVYTHHMKPRVDGFAGAYGSASFSSLFPGIRADNKQVLFFEDETDLIELQQKNPMVAGLVNEWSDHSGGAHHVLLWAALEAEGLGCNLQHVSIPWNHHSRILISY
jgi:predicted oxidoreductase (fatty acid repression mutant protein)